MDALIETLTRNPEIKREDSQKLFYKRFPYKVVFSHNTYNDANDGRFSKPFTVGGQIYPDLVVLQTQEILSLVSPNTDQVKVRTQGGFSSFYFVEESQAQEFIEANAAYITSVSLPISDKALTAIKDDVRIEIRDTLYWNKYRWAAVCKSLTLDQLDEIREWINNYKEQIGTTEDRVCLSYSSSSPRIFFAEEDDLFMFKFAYFNRVSRLEKVLLKKEIADELLIAEGSH